MSDKPALCILWNTVFPNPSAHNLPERIIDDKLATQPELLFVAMADNELVGSIIAGYDGHRGWLNLVAVAPTHRGHRIGTKLVEHAIDELKRLNCGKVNIQIREGNEQVIAFYRHLGFAPEARVSMSLFIE